MQVFIITENKPRSPLHEWTPNDSIYWSDVGRRNKVDHYYTTEQLARQICERLNRTELPRQFKVVNMTEDMCLSNVSVRRKAV